MLIGRRGLILGTLGLGAAAAQGGQALPASTDEPEGPLFPQLFPRPTGQNGYEELVLAIDQLRRSARFKQSQEMTGSEGGLTLAFRRRVLADPPVVRALTLVRRGLAKRV